MHYELETQKKIYCLQLMFEKIEIRANFKELFDVLLLSYS